MSQPRVTDFFAQRKKSDLSRASRAKGQKTHNEDNGALAVRVIDEATSVKVGSEPSSFIRSDSETLTLHESPKTPKRTCADAEFDLGSAVFSTTADHSTAKKKRLQVESSVTVKVVDKTSVKTARKKLILSKDTEQQDVEQGVLQLPQNSPQSVDNDSKTILIHGTNSPTTKHRNQSTANKSPTGNEALSKDAVTTLKARLQKIKAQAEKLSSSPSPAPEAVSTAPGLQAKLARARQLAARAEQRKVRATEDQAQPLAEEKQPSYQRYHTLAQDIPPGLSLPYHYKLLADAFRSMDTITGMLFNRSETVTFAKLKQGVEDMTRRRFEETHVGQIKTVYPSAYTFRQERNIPTFSSTLKKSSYQLTLEPVLEDSEGTGKPETRPTLSASRQLERRRIFHKSLVNMVKEHHKVFLSSLNPPVTVPDDKLTRWHPRFNVDQVPQPQPSFLPQPPQTEKMTTAQEVLDNARSIMTPKMEKALAKMSLKTAETGRAKELASVPPQPGASPMSAPGPNPVETPSALKGVSQSLLERIRTKEAQKLQVAMTRNPLQEERLLMLSRLCELARILRNVFVAEKKPALIMELTCNRMVSSYRSALSTGEMEKHLRLLAELTPEWLVIHKIRKDFYFKLNKTMDLSMVLQKLNHKMKEEELV
ncbi:DNA replication factor Cdt1 isoform X2 [Hypomesus transpacificus]|uniref:DNA replication factor Cdt1 isoform X2 n=1 Tax=Hypomesus transpacificus TaxID=137520 RepID=UPI001F074C5E|nr:DNA replication factor Cdt1 isoform X2 [Hypomesus transpacificus]